MRRPRHDRRRVSAQVSRRQPPAFYLGGAGAQFPKRGRWWPLPSAAAVHYRPGLTVFSGSADQGCPQQNPPTPTVCTPRRGGNGRPSRFYFPNNAPELLAGDAPRERDNLISLNKTRFEHRETL